VNKYKEREIMETKEDIIKSFVEEDKQHEPTTEAAVEVSEKKETVETKEEPTKNRTQKRIDALIKEKYELKAKLAEKENAKEATTDKEIELSDFDTYEEFIQALEENEEAKEAPKEATKPVKEGLVIEQFQEKIEDMTDKYPDFKEKVYSDNAVITVEMIEDFNESTIGGDLVYYYANNPVEALKVAKMSDKQRIRAIAKKEVELTSPKAIKQRVTDAPTPIAGVKDGVQDIDIDNMNVDEIGKYFQSKSTTW
jgi:hypothetical protein